MEALLKKHAEKIRFLFVGGGLTALDFALLFLLTFAGIDKIVANYFSTGLSMIVSFFVNKQFTFKNKTGNTKKQFSLFIIVTIIGLWVIQPLIIWISTSTLAPHLNNEAINLFIAKLIATVESLTWNYLLYSRLVFKKAPESN
jgi:putative flippase GtrA